MVPCLTFSVLIEGVVVGVICCWCLLFFANAGSSFLSYRIIDKTIDVRNSFLHRSMPKEAA